MADRPTKLLTSAYADAYGLRVPNSVTLRQLKTQWAIHLPSVSASALAKASSRNPKISAWTIKNQILPRESIVALHNVIVAQAKAKPLVTPSSPLPTYDAAPDYSLLRLIGIEFEGGWYSDRVRAHSLRVKNDGSVSVTNRFPAQTGDQNLRGDDANETCSDPDCDWGLCREARARAAGGVVEQPRMEERNRLGFQAGEVEFGPWRPDEIGEGWAAAFERSYPEEVNATCGQHVHVSFPSTGIYGAFVREDFRPWLISGLTRWAASDGAELPANWGERMEGRNHYCKAAYDPNQLWNNGDRYTQVNYCARKHGTMEVRVLPMFATPAQSKAAITELIRLVAIWANAFAPRPRKPILLGAAEMDGSAEAMAASAGGRWANFDPNQPIRCPQCNHDINSCRGYRANRDWDSLRAVQRSWLEHRGTVVGCCANGGVNHTAFIPPDSEYAQILTAIYNGEITDNYAEAA